MANVTQWLTST